MPWAMNMPSAIIVQLSIVAEGILRSVATRTATQQPANMPAHMAITIKMEVMSRTQQAPGNVVRQPAHTLIKATTAAPEWSFSIPSNVPAAFAPTTPKTVAPTELHIGNRPESARRSLSAKSSVMPARHKIRGEMLRTSAPATWLLVDSAD
jgi:hypothetical protein